MIFQLYMGMHPLSGDCCSLHMSSFLMDCCLGSRVASAADGEILLGRQAYLPGLDQLHSVQHASHPKACADP